MRLCVCVCVRVCMRVCFQSEVMKCVQFLVIHTTILPLQEVPVSWLY